MKWFQHNNNLRHSPEFAQMMDKLSGPMGYGVAVMIWEIVCEYGDDDFKLPYSGKFGHTFWAREFGVLDVGKPEPGSIKAGRAQAEIILGNAAAAEVIDPVAWQQRIVYAPQLRKYVDEFHKERQRKAKRLAATQDQ
jgi:hypothetical protein